MWIAAEKRADAQALAGVTDWLAGGVTLTSRWLAAAPHEYRGRRRMPIAPITRTTSSAIEELIEAEYLAAVTVAGDVRSPPGQWLPGLRRRRGGDAELGVAL